MFTIYVAGSRLCDACLESGLGSKGCLSDQEREETY